MFSDTEKIITGYAKEIQKIASNTEGNLMALMIGDCITYLRFLEVIYQRYKKNYELYVELFKKQDAIFRSHENGVSWQPNKEELELVSSISSVMIQLRLDIESFLVFTAVLLNKITNFPKRYFKHDILRGVKCGSHHQFWKSIRKNKKLAHLPSRDLLDNVDWMQKNVIDFRDDLIIHTLKTDHTEKQLIKGFTSHPEKEGSIMTTMLYPDPKIDKPKQYQSVELKLVITKLKEFIPQIVGFYRNNHTISILDQK